MAATLLTAAFSLLFGKLSSMFSEEVPNFWWQNSHYFTEQAVNESVLLVSILWLHNLKNEDLYSCDLVAEHKEVEPPIFLMHMLQWIFPIQN